MKDIMLLSAFCQPIPEYPIEAHASKRTIGDDFSFLLRQEDYIDAQLQGLSE